MDITAAILVIGDEILSGRTSDKNIGYMASHFTTIGINLREVRIVPDIEEEIIAAVNTLRQRYTYLFTTGGIGPTHDDITADAIAKACGVEIDYDDRAIALMEAHYKPGDFTASRRRMARIPSGAELIENSISAAPGFWIENVIVMAGVPAIMQVMLDAVTPKLEKGAPINTVTLGLDQPESTVAEMLGEHQNAYQDVSMGSYPFHKDGKFGTQLVLRACDDNRLNEAVKALQEKLNSEQIEFKRL